MTRRPGDETPEPPGGRAAERLREFIDQRYPGGVPLPEGAREPGRDANHETEQVESGKQTKVQLDRLEQTFQQLVETLQGFETRLNRLEQAVQELVETKKPTGASPEEQDKAE
jgi:hypothetical protein